MHLDEIIASFDKYLPKKTEIVKEDRIRHPLLASELPVHFDYKEKEDLIGLEKYV